MQAFSAVLLLTYFHARMNYKDLLVTVASYLKQPKKRKLIKAGFSLKGLEGIEIGGPSALFGLQAAFPVYVFADSIDGVNYSDQTVWEGNISAGRTYQYFPGKTGQQYIAEATDLSQIKSASYDFLLSCHSLEHVANPIKALAEWKRVLKPGGRLILVLPDKRFTFDINRPYTSLEHLNEDFKNGTDEHDRTHFEEIIEKHDPSKDPGMKEKDQIEALLKDNFKNRMAHHHVFSQELVKSLLEQEGFNVQEQHETGPFHLITIARKK